MTQPFFFFSWRVWFPMNSPDRSLKALYTYAYVCQSFIEITVTTVKLMQKYLVPDLKLNRKRAFISKIILGSIISSHIDLESVSGRST